MITTAKIFKAGRSQAVRLPKAFRLECDEVWISRNEATGVVTLSPKKKTENLDALFKLIEEAEVPENFMVERQNFIEYPRNPLKGWKA